MQGFQSFKGIWRVKIPQIETLLLQESTKNRNTAINNSVS